MKSHLIAIASEICLVDTVKQEQNGFGMVHEQIEIKIQQLQI